MKIVRTTEKLRLDRPTRQFLLVPFFGVVLMCLLTLDRIFPLVWSNIVSESLVHAECRLILRVL